MDMSRGFLVACYFIVVFCSAVPTAVVAEERPMVVATRQVPPFAFKDEAGRWQGLSIELWRDIAGRLGWDYEFRETGLKEMLDAVAEGRVDAAVAALTITSEREQRMDFTHPFLSTGLGIAVSRQGGNDWVAVSQRLVSGPFLRALGVLTGLLLGVGVLVWLFERRRNEQFGGGPAKGIGSGLWWSAVTMTTVGYGDKCPQTLGGRLVGLVWMFASIIVISSFTAAIATALTVGELHGKVHDRGDLARVQVASVGDSTSAQYLRNEKLRFRVENSLGDALESLSRGGVDAVVYDAPILRYQVQQAYQDRLSVLPGSFERQDYGIALPTGSPRRESINRALLQALHQRNWENSLYRYLGERE
jgi:polar amino acid transport system substrate-binding protein